MQKEKKRRRILFLSDPARVLSPSHLPSARSPTRIRNLNPDPNPHRPLYSPSLLNCSYQLLRSPDPENPPVEMLLAVEGGGFFSSSASGYSKGLMLLLLGQGKEERPMRVAPWNQYQLVEQEGDHKHQLAARKGGASSRGCASFVCFRRASAGVDGPPPPKVGPVSHSETLPGTSSSDSDQGRSCNSKQGIDESEWKLCLKSNLKKPSINRATIISEGDNARETVEEGQNCVISCMERRKVQWTDSCGRELVQIREFEPSEDGSSDDDFENDGLQRCHCVIQ